MQPKQPGAASVRNSTSSELAVAAGENNKALNAPCRRRNALSLSELILIVCFLFLLLRACVYVCVCVCVCVNPLLFASCATLLGALCVCSLDIRHPGILRSRHYQLMHLWREHLHLRQLYHRWVGVCVCVCVCVCVRGRDKEKESEWGRHWGWWENRGKRSFRVKKKKKYDPRFIPLWTEIRSPHLFSRVQSVWGLFSGPCNHTFFFLLLLQQSQQHTLIFPGYLFKEVHTCTFSRWQFFPGAYSGKTSSTRLKEWVQMFSQPVLGLR